MTEIPEHLRKRAEEARRKAAAAKGGGAPAGEADAGDGGGAGEAPRSEAASRIPAHLLERSKAAKSRAAGGDAGGGAAPAVVAAPAPAAAAAAPPLATGPGGHTQRLLTVVKSGSIQDVKAVPQDKVHVWPHLLGIEFVAALAITAFLLIFSVFVNAPLLALANVNQTPNPSKAPWYFLGLQELLTMFHPMVAGVSLAAGAWLASTTEGTLRLYASRLFLLGLFGNGAFVAPLLANTTRWFDRRRGMISLSDPVVSNPEVTALVFEHESLASAMASLFEDFWKRSEPR